MMNDTANKTAICSVIALDIIDYSKKTNAEQVEIKRLLNHFIQQALIDIPQDDRVIANTVSGALIACKGPLEDALEDALFISITLRDEALAHNILATTPIYLQFGIHLGAARASSDSIMGEGADEAKRIMRFAKPNQILVSNVYVEMASKLTQEIAQMFEKYEMHAHEHDVYAVRLLKGAAADDSPSIPTEIAETAPALAQHVNWNYVGLGILSLAALLMLAKLVITPIEPTITLVNPAPNIPIVTKPAETKPTVEAAEIIVNDSGQAPTGADNPLAAVRPSDTLTANEEEIKKTDAASQAAKKALVKKEQIKQAPTRQPQLTQKKPQQQDALAETTPNNAEKPAATAAGNKTNTDKTAKQADAKVEKEAAKEKSGWQTFKDSVTTGADRKCTQAEIALNQCAK